MYLLSPCCSMCLTTDADLSRIYDENLQLLYKLNYCVPEIEYSNEEFHLYICPDCYDKLDEAYSFIEMCIQSYSTIVGYVSQLKNRDAEENLHSFLKIPLLRGYKVHPVDFIHRITSENEKKYKVTAVQIEQIGNTQRENKTQVKLQNGAPSETQNGGLVRSVLLEKGVTRKGFYDERSDDDFAEEVEDVSPPKKSKILPVKPKKKPSYETPKRRVWNCTLCNKKLFYKRNLNKHMAEHRRNSNKNVVAKVKHSSAAVKAKHSSAAVTVTHSSAAVKAKHSSAAVEVKHSSAAVDVKHSSAAVKVKHSNAAVDVKHSSAAVDLKHSSAAVEVKHSSAAVKVKHSSAAVDLKHSGAAVKVKHSSAAVDLKHSSAAVEVKHFSAVSEIEPNKSIANFRNIGQDVTMSEVNQPTSLMDTIIWDKEIKLEPKFEPTYEEILKFDEKNQLENEYNKSEEIKLEPELELTKEEILKFDTELRQAENNKIDSDKQSEKEKSSTNLEHNYFRGVNTNNTRKRAADKPITDLLNDNNVVFEAVNKTPFLLPSYNQITEVMDNISKLHQSSQLKPADNNAAILAVNDNTCQLIRAGITAIILPNSLNTLCVFGNNASTSSVISVDTKSESNVSNHSRPVKEDLNDNKINDNTCELIQTDIGGILKPTVSDTSLEFGNNAFGNNAFGSNASTSSISVDTVNNSNQSIPVDQGLNIVIKNNITGVANCFECSICYKTFSFRYFNKHMEQHKMENRTPPNILTRRVLLKPKELGNKCYECEICKEKFLLQRFYDKHLTSHKKKNVPQKQHPHVKNVVSNIKQQKTGNKKEDSVKVQRVEKIFLNRLWEKSEFITQCPTFTLPKNCQVTMVANLPSETNTNALNDADHSIEDLIPINAIERPPEDNVLWKNINEGLNKSLNQCLSSPSPLTVLTVKDTISSQIANVSPREAQDFKGFMSSDFLNSVDMNTKVSAQPVNEYNFGKIVSVKSLASDTTDETSIIQQSKPFRIKPVQDGAKKKKKALEKPLNAFGKIVAVKSLASDKTGGTSVLQQVPIGVKTVQSSDTTNKTSIVKESVPFGIKPVQYDGKIKKSVGKTLNAFGKLVAIKSPSILEQPLPIGTQIVEDGEMNKKVAAKSMIDYNVGKIVAIGSLASDGTAKMNFKIADSTVNEHTFGKIIAIQSLVSDEVKGYELMQNVQNFLPELVPIQKQDGGIQKQDGGIQKQDGGIQKQNGGIQKQDGGVQKQDGEIQKQDGGKVIGVHSLANDKPSKTNVLKELVSIARKIKVQDNALAHSTIQNIVPELVPMREQDGENNVVSNVEKEPAKTNFDQIEEATNRFLAQNNVSIHDSESLIVSNKFQNLVQTPEQDIENSLPSENKLHSTQEKDGGHSLVDPKEPKNLVPGQDCENSVPVSNKIEITSDIRIQEQDKFVLREQDGKISLLAQNKEKEDGERLLESENNENRLRQDDGILVVQNEEKEDDSERLLESKNNKDHSIQRQDDVNNEVTSTIQDSDIENFVEMQEQDGGHSSKDPETISIQDIDSEIETTFETQEQDGGHSSKDPETISIQDIDSDIESTFETQEQDDHSSKGPETIYIQDIDSEIETTFETQEQDGGHSSKDPETIYIQDIDCDIETSYEMQEQDGSHRSKDPETIYIQDIDCDIETTFEMQEQDGGHRSKDPETISIQDIDSEIETSLNSPINLDTDDSSSDVECLLVPYDPYKITSENVKSNKTDTDGKISRKPGKIKLRRPFKCNLCNKRFLTTRNYEKHLKYSKHNNTSAGKVTDPVSSGQVSGKVTNRTSSGKVSKKVTNRASSGKVSDKVTNRASSGKVSDKVTNRASSGKVSDKVTNRASSGKVSDKVTNRASSRKKTEIVTEDLTLSGSVSTNYKEENSCLICKKQFPNKNLLEGHMPNHDVDEETNVPVRCHICDKLLSRKSSLVRHILAHKGIKPHTCHICQKTFTEKHNLRNHTETHAAEKQFTCHLCPRAFFVHQRLRRHLKYDHRSLNEPFFALTDELGEKNTNTSSKNENPTSSNYVDSSSSVSTDENEEIEVD